MIGKFQKYYECIGYSQRTPLFHYMRTLCFLSSIALKEKLLYPLRELFELLRLQKTGINRVSLVTYPPVNLS